MSYYESLLAQHVYSLETNWNKQTHRKKEGDHRDEMSLEQGRKSQIANLQPFGTESFIVSVCARARLCVSVFFLVFVQFPSNLERNEMIIMKTMGIISLAMPQSPLL